MPIVFEQPRPFDIRYYPMGGQGRGGGGSGGGGGDKGGGGGGRQPSGGGGREKEDDGEDQAADFEGIDTQPTEDQIAALSDKSDAQYDWEMDTDTATRQAEEAAAAQAQRDAGYGGDPANGGSAEDVPVQVQPTQDGYGGDPANGGSAEDLPVGDGTGYQGDPANGGSAEDAPAGPGAPTDGTGYMGDPANGGSAEDTPVAAPAPPPGQPPPQQQPRPQPQPQYSPPPPEFTQADALDLSRLQNSLAQMRSRLRNGELDAGTARRVNQLIQRGIKPLQALQQVAQQQKQAAVLQQHQSDMAHQTAIDLTNQRMRQQAGTDGIARNLPDGRGGVLPPSQWNPQKQIWEAMPHVQEAADRRERAATAAADRDATQSEARQTRADAQYSHEQDRYDRILKDARKDILTDPNGEPTEEQLTQIDKRMRDAGFQIPNGEHASFAGHMAQLQQLQARPFVVNQGNRNTPERNLAGFQRAQLQEFQQGLRDGAERLPQSQLNDLNEHIQASRRLFAEAGSIPRMTAGEKREWTEHARAISRLLNPPRQQQQQTPAAPQQQSTGGPPAVNPWQGRVRDIQARNMLRQLQGMQ